MENIRQMLSNPKLVFYVIFAFVVVVFAYIYYTFFVFHIAHSSPQDNTMPTSYSSMIFEFNMPLKKQDEQKNLKVYIDPEINEWNYKISKNTITINFHSTFGENEEFTLYIKNILSEKGDQYNFQKKYTVKYVDLADLPKEDVERLTTKSDSFETRFPLIKDLPIEGETYTIDYIYPDNDNQKKLPIIISSNFNLTTNNPSGIPSKSEKDDYLESLKKSRKDALDLLWSYGYNESDYYLYFNEPYLLKEFNGSYIGDDL